MILLGGVVLLSGCHRMSHRPEDGAARGRFAGIGIYDAGRMWRQMATPEAKDPALATLADDEHVIVVIDSHSGEVRQCGDHSGQCVAMNPWAASAASGLPVHVLKHAAELDADDKAAVEIVKDPAPASSGK
jgi:hypothetical protein